MKENLAFVGAGAAAGLSRAALHFLAKDLAYGATPWGDPLEIRFVTGLVFFAVLVTLGRQAFRNDVQGDAGTMIDHPSVAPRETPYETAADMARIFAGVTDDLSRRRAMREWLSGVPKLTVLIPFIFYLRFGIIGPLGWGLTVFFDVYCLLWAIGLYFLPRTAYHSTVRLRGDWVDRVGAFWLVGCAFGPLFGWLVTEGLPITRGSWYWLYGLRIFLAAGVPIITALPLMRYMRGKATLVALPLAVAITMLPVSTVVQVIQDLWEGPRVRQVQGQSTSRSEFYLQHTERSLGGIP